MERHQDDHEDGYDDRDIHVDLFLDESHIHLVRFHNECADVCILYRVVHPSDSDAMVHIHVIERQDKDEVP